MQLEQQALCSRECCRQKEAAVIETLPGGVLPVSNVSKRWFWGQKQPYPGLGKIWRCCFKNGGFPVSGKGFVSSGGGVWRVVLLSACCCWWRSLHKNTTAIELPEQNCPQKLVSAVSRAAGLTVGEPCLCVRHNRASPGHGENKGGGVLRGDPASSFLPTLVLHLKDNRIIS